MGATTVHSEHDNMLWRSKLTQLLSLQSLRQAVIKKCCMKAVVTVTTSKHWIFRHHGLIPLGRGCLAVWRWFPHASRSAINRCAWANCGRVGCSSSGIAWSASSPSCSCTSRVSMAPASSSSASSSSPTVKMEVAISCGALPCKSPSGSGPRLPLRQSVPPFEMHQVQEPDLHFSTEVDLDAF